MRAKIRETNGNILKGLRTKSKYRLFASGALSHVNHGWRKAQTGDKIWGEGGGVVKDEKKKKRKQIKETLKTYYLLHVNSWDPFTKVECSRSCGHSGHHQGGANSLHG